MEKPPGRKWDNCWVSAQSIEQPENPTHDQMQATTPNWERRAIIDLANMRENVKRVSELVAPAKIMAVVKADGYGHGAVAVGRAALQAGATWLGCAHVTEALELRARAHAPLLAWLHTEGTPFEDAIAANIDIAVSGWELDYVACRRAAAQPARVHLKIDTGLGRNGSTPADWDALLGRAASYQEEGLMRIVGVFSHLAVADEPERPETDEQLKPSTKPSRSPRTRASTSRYATSPTPPPSSPAPTRTTTWSGWAWASTD